jgi:hypothetical protein
MPREGYRYEESDAFRMTKFKFFPKGDVVVVVSHGDSEAIRFSKLAFGSEFEAPIDFSIPVTFT